MDTYFDKNIYLLLLKNTQKTKRLLSCWFSIVQQGIIRKGETYLLYIAVYISKAFRLRSSRLCMPGCTYLSLNILRHTRQYKDLKSYSKTFPCICVLRYYIPSPLSFFFPREFWVVHRTLVIIYSSRVCLLWLTPMRHTKQNYFMDRFFLLPREAPVRKTLICKGTVETGLMH